jgi:hypothetical protein
MVFVHGADSLFRELVGRRPEPAAVDRVLSAVAEGRVCVAVRTAHTGRSGRGGAR